MPPFQSLSLSGELLAEIVAQAHDAAPNECCGLLAGQIVDRLAVATARFAIGNDAASPHHYLTNPRDMLAAFREIRKRRLELVAIYHSHPLSAAKPSPSDLEGNTYGQSVAHLIVSLAESQPQVCGWWLYENAACSLELLRG